MSSWPHDRSRAPSDAGLTLLELLVASAVAMILIVSVYYVYSASTRGYRIQAQVMGAMHQARFGLEQLQRDLNSAGFLATPLSTADTTVCPKPAGVLRGIVFSKGGAVAEPSSNQRVVPEGVTLFGSFWTPTVYFSQSVVGNTVTLQGPADGAPFPASREEFEQIFRERRFLRIVNADQFEMYLPITSNDYVNRTITLSSPVPTATPPDFCGVQGFGVGLEVTVAGFVRYRLVDDASELGKVDLVRQELDGSDAALSRVLAKTTIRVAEYVAELRFFDFAMDVDRTGRRPTLQQFATLDDVIGSGTQVLDLTANARPQDLRFVTVQLTTRTRDEDESFPFVTRTALDRPLDSYEVDPSMAGSAHTVSLAARVSLPSFEVRNVK